METGEGIVFLASFTDAELREGNERIATGEDALAVWQEICGRDPERWRREGERVGLTLAEIVRRKRSKE